MITSALIAYVPCDDAPVHAQANARPYRDINAIETAQTLLIAARNKLQDAGAHKSANYVRGAIKSVQGALNNARAHLFREQRAPDLSDTGPYATAEDHATARALRITVRALRAQRAAEDA